MDVFGLGFIYLFIHSYLLCVCVRSRASACAHVCVSVCVLCKTFCCGRERECSDSLVLRQGRIVENLTNWKSEGSTAESAHRHRCWRHLYMGNLHKLSSKGRRNPLRNCSQFQLLLRSCLGWNSCLTGMILVHSLFRLYLPAWNLQKRAMIWYDKKVCRIRTNILKQERWQLLSHLTELEPRRWSVGWWLGQPSLITWSLTPIRPRIK